MLLKLHTCSLSLLLSAFLSVAHAAHVDPSLLVHPEIEALSVATNAHYLLQHDFLRCFAGGMFANMSDAARIFFQNHYVYSRDFIKYLTLVAHKVEDPSIVEPILENIGEENGNYEQEDVDEMTAHGIDKDWYVGIPHKNLSRRFLNSVGVNVSDLNQVNAGSGFSFTSDMVDAYTKANACEALAIIGFAIEQTVSVMYKFLWDGLKKYTTLSPDEYVFFPLHILIDDGHSDLLKLGYKQYLINDHESCGNAFNLVTNILDRRVQMFDEVRNQIETAQGQKCTLPQHKTDAEVVVEVDVAGAVLDAQRETLSLSSQNIQTSWTLSQRMAMSARILSDQGHGMTLSGQITCRHENPNSELVQMWSTPYGLSLELISAKDMILIDANLRVLEGERFPNRATRFHFHVYQKRPDIKCLIHTHPPHASALAMIGEPLHVAHMDVMAFYEDVQFLDTWPGIPFGDEEGELISGVLKDKWSALLAHHGLIVGGKTIEEATYRAYFFERAAKMQLKAMSAKQGQLPQVNPEVARKARDWRISEGPVQAHFNGWARVALKNGHQDAI